MPYILKINYLEKKYNIISHRENAIIYKEMNYNNYFYHYHYNS